MGKKKNFINYLLSILTKLEKVNVIIRANTYDPSGEDLSLKPLTDDKEWKVIENILISTQEQLREEMAKEGSNNEEDGNTSN